MKAKWNWIKGLYKSLSGQNIIIFLIIQANSTRTHFLYICHKIL